jgi:hypothetical protein
LSISRTRFSLPKADADTPPGTPSASSKVSATPPFGPCVGARLLFDHLVSAQQNRWGYRKAERRSRLAELNDIIADTDERATEGGALMVSCSAGCSSPSALSDVAVRDGSAI